MKAIRQSALALALVASGICSQMPTGALYTPLTHDEGGAYIGGQTTCYVPGISPSCALQNGVCSLEGCLNIGNVETCGGPKTVNNNQNKGLTYPVAETTDDIFNGQVTTAGSNTSCCFVVTCDTGCGDDGNGTPSCKGQNFAANAVPGCLTPSTTPSGNPCVFAYNDSRRTGSAAVLIAQLNGLGFEPF
jgi:hypothetical protein